MDGNFGERQEAAVHDWGYYAHLSIYDFAKSFAARKRFLDIGCGTGYGSQYILDNGALSVTSLERDAELVSRLKTRYPLVRFFQCDLDDGTLPVPDQSIDVAFTSNVLEHVAYPNPVVDEIRRVLRRDGVAIVAIPPVSTVGMLKENAKNIFHINNLPHQVWQSKLERYFGSVEPYRHWVAVEKSINDTDIDRDSIHSVADFVFSPCDKATDFTHTITAAFVCRAPREHARSEDTEIAIPALWKHLRIEADGRQEAFVELNRQIENLTSELKRHIDIIHDSDRFWREQMRIIYDSNDLEAIKNFVTNFGVDTHRTKQE